MSISLETLVIGSNGDEIHAKLNDNIERLSKKLHIIIDKLAVIEENEVQNSNKIDDLIEKFT